MQGNQDIARKLLFRSEGGYTVDKGGPTMRGVTLTAFRAALKDPNATVEQLKAITEDQAWAIFMHGYLTPIWFDKLPAGVDYMLADFSVNSGPHTAVKHLQRVLIESGEKDLAADGLMGPKTMAAVLDFEPDAVINAVLDERLEWMRTLSNWPEAGRGWTNRIAQVRTAALALAKVPPTAPAKEKPMEPTATLQTPATAPAAAPNLPGINILAGLSNTFENLAHSLVTGKKAVDSPDVPTPATATDGLGADLAAAEACAKEIFEAVAHARSGNVTGTIGDVVQLLTIVFGALDRHGIKVPAATMALKAVSTFLG